MLQLVVSFQRVVQLLHAQGHALVGQRVDLLRRDALYIVVVDVLPVCDIRSKSKSKPPTSSRDGHESRRWRMISERPRDAEIVPFEIMFFDVGQ